MARLPSRVASVMLVFLALASGSCRKRDRAAPGEPPAVVHVVPVLGAVAVEDRTPPESRPAGVTLDEQALSTAVRAQLQAANVFAAPGGSSPPCTANVTVLLALEHVEAGDKAAGHVVAKLTITPKPEGLAEDRWKEDSEVVSEAPYERAKPPADLAGMFRKLAERTVHDLLDQYVARQKLRTATEAEVLKLLTSDHGELRDEAIKVAGERKLGGTVPRLLELLDDSDEGVRDSALGALVAMRERRAVSALTRSRSLRDRREMRKIIEAVSLLGGDEAKQYLEFVAEAHDDADMKRLAKEALTRMARRGATSSL